MIIIIRNNYLVNQDVTKSRLELRCLIFVFRFWFTFYILYANSVYFS